MKTEIRILHIFGCMDRGGAEMRTLDVMENIERSRFRMDFCSLSGRRGELDSHIRELGATVHYVKLDFRFPVRFIRMLRTEKYNVVHSHVHYSSGPILWLAKRAGIPGRIAHFRTVYDGKKMSPTRWIRQFFFKMMIKHSATHILAVSRTTMDCVWPSWQADRRCQVVYNGINLSRYHGPRSSSENSDSLVASPGIAKILHVGRMSPIKNQKRVLAIFSEAIKSNENIRLFFVGDKSNRYAEELQALIRKEGLENQVFMLGIRRDIPMILKNADVLILPSLWEGLPGVVLEATAAGIPVLASDLAGLREILRMIPSISLEKLESSNEIWAKGLMDLINRPKSVIDLQRTVFDINVVISHLSAIWENASI